MASAGHESISDPAVHLEDGRDLREASGNETPRRIG